MYIRFFIVLAILGLSVLPVINLAKQDLTFKQMGRIKYLYNTDVVEGYINRALVKVGISADPNRVVIGTHGWLYLGDAHSSAITAYRRGADVEEAKKVAQEVVHSQVGWKDYYHRHGVKDFKILVGPNKNTIYSEYLPQWAKSSNNSISEYLYTGHGVYVDVRNALLNNKGETPLYYHTDTHWNYYGAGVAFNIFTQQLSEAESLVLPPSSWSELVEIVPKSGGDLAAFLKARQHMKDVDTLTKINGLNLQHNIYDFNSGVKVYSGSNALPSDMNELSLIETPAALNNKKVLWLSDSFGNALAPYMAATFNQILKQHWSKLMTNEKLFSLIEEWQPDYVFITVVERDSLHEIFMIYPPDN